jgi:hypothetical protein
MLFVVIAVAVQIAAQTARPSYEGIGGVVYRVQSGLVPEADEENLILGDSRSLRGIDPGLLEEALGDGSRWRNLSMVGLPPLGVLLLLRRYADEHGAPKRVIYALSPHVMGGMQPFGGMFAKLYPLRLRDVWDAAMAPIPRQMRYRWLMASFLPILRQRNHLRVALEAAVGFDSPELSRRMPRPFDSPAGSPRMRREIERTRAALPETRGYVPKTWGMNPTAVQTALAGWSRMRFRVLPVNQQYIDAVCELARELGTELHLVTPPIPELLNEVRMQSGYNSAYGQWLARLEEQHPELHLKERNIIGYPHGLFADVIHLRDWGAETYTLELAGYLAGLR